MTNPATQQLLEKYHDIIAEEVNVKEVISLPEDFQVTVSYVPLGQQLSAKFGKDTGLIIGAAKEGNVEPLSNWQIKVSVGDNEWILDRNEYEVRYHGLDESKQTVEEGVIVSLDLTITEELKAEGIAREISRFLNQMRKESWFQVDDRVVCNRNSNADELIRVIETYTTFLKDEALLKDITRGIPSEAPKLFESEEGTITFSLHK